MGKFSLMGKRHALHHPEHISAGAMKRGRFLEPDAIARAKRWCEQKVSELTRKGLLSNNERHLLAHLMSR